MCRNNNSTGTDLRPLLALLVLIAAAACAVSIDNGGPSVNGNGTDGGSQGGDDTGPRNANDAGQVTGDTGVPTPQNGEIKLTGALRDFLLHNPPDFENPTFSQTGNNIDDRGFVSQTLGTDKKPVYAGPASGTATTSGPDNFNEWYNDMTGVNQSMQLTITLTKGAGDVFTYDNQAFFPTDGQLLGNQGDVHNYSFTYELHTTFHYGGGEMFKFTGDDDLFVFINNKLVIDLGGIHSAETGTADLDSLATSLGLQIGGTYHLDLFFAERHRTGSHFRIDTSIGTLRTGPN